MSQRNSERARIYYAAKDFVHLDFQQKFNIGFQMGFCDWFDAQREEESLEEYIFVRVIKEGALEEFMNVVRRVKYEYENESC